MKYDGKKDDQTKASAGEYWASYSSIPGPPDSYTALSEAELFYVEMIDITSRYRVGHQRMKRVIRPASNCIPTRQMILSRLKESRYLC